MRKRVFMMTAMLCIACGLYAQSTMRMNYDKAKYAPTMRWSCPDIAKYHTLLNSLSNEDEKIYANHVMSKIDLVTFPEAPSDKFMVTQTIMTIENPLFYSDNLLNHISSWIKSKKKDWGKNLKIEGEDKSIVSSASIHVASHSRFMHLNKVYISPSLIIQLIEDNKLMVTFMNLTYKNDEYTGSDRRPTAYNQKVSDVFPFDAKSSYKNTYAKAYVGTYLYFWNFISDLYNELNTNFIQDPKMLNQLHYEYSQDSLKAMYGEPTKVFADQSSMPDVKKELRFYEAAQKMVFMDETIDFKNILSCEIVDDPTFIPGHTTSYGVGFSLFGIGIGRADSYTTAGKTIHSYVVNVKIDDMRTPLIYIATGQNEQKANEIAAVFEYIMRHQNSSKPSAAQKSRTATRRRK